MKCVIVGALALLSAGASAQLNNPSFEVAGPDAATPFVGWNSFNNVIPNIVQEAIPLTGSFCGKMFGPSFEDPPGTPVAGDTGIRQGFFTTPGEYLEASIWAAHLSSDPVQGNNTGFLSIVFYDQFSNILSDVATNTINAGTPADVYEQYTVSALVPPDAVTGEVVIGMYQGDTADRGGAILFDDVAIQSVTPPDQVIVGIDDSTAPWLGYMNVLDLPQNGGLYQFGSPWAVEDLVAEFDDTTGKLTMKPNSIDDPDPYYYQGGGAPGAPGNKVMEANLYQELTDTLQGKLLTFEGTVLSNDFTSEHEAYIFIRDFAPNYGSFAQAIIPAVPGDFSLSLVTVDAPGRHVQWGLQVSGVCVWITDVDPFGSIVYRTGDGPTGCPADLSPAPNGDGAVNTNDFFQFLTYYQAQDSAADFSPPGGDGAINTNDFFAFLAAYQQGC